MKITLLAAVTALVFTVATPSVQAADFHVAAQKPEANVAGGCEGSISRVADVVGAPQPCCDRALGCAQFLATTRVIRRHLEPHT